MGEINKLVMYGDKLPGAISICDCTGHMVDGGKKDAEYIINFSKKRLMSLIHQKSTMILLF